VTILFFPNGTIQCVGGFTDGDLPYLHSTLENLLSDSLSEWEVKTMTVLCELNYHYDFRKVTSSNNLTYEVELFPAAQMTNWHPYHVHVFHNGKIVITGIKDINDVPPILCDLRKIFVKSTL